MSFGQICSAYNRPIKYFKIIIKTQLFLLNLFPGVQHPKRKRYTSYWLSRKSHRRARIEKFSVKLHDPRSNYRNLLV